MEIWQTTFVLSCVVEVGTGTSPGDVQMEVGPETWPGDVQVEVGPGTWPGDVQNFSLDILKASEDEQMKLVDLKQ
jgi:hypothetical protein